MTEPAAAAAIARATALGLRVAVAESLTGGLLTAALVEVPGASRVVSGGVVAYDTALKASLLGVATDLLVRQGPVDAEVARQMARGVRRACSVPRGVDAALPTALGTPSPDDAARSPSRFDADIGLSTTGVAGPDPDAHTGQPAGTVWIGVSSVRGDRAVSLQIEGTREEIRAATVAAALVEFSTELTMLVGASLNPVFPTP